MTELKDIYIRTKLDFEKNETITNGIFSIILYDASDAIELNSKYDWF